MVDNKQLRVSSVGYALENGRDRDKHVEVDKVIEDAQKIYEYLSKDDK